MINNRMVYIWSAVYAFIWTWLTVRLDPTVPYDAIEAIHWVINGEWGTPKNPWLVAWAQWPLVWLPVDLRPLYWYLSHFIAVAIGMVGVWMLAWQLTRQRELAWLALLTLNLSGIINFDIIPYNDNYLLVMTWPWMMFLFLQAIRSPWWWLPFAFIAGLAMMAKYSTIVLIAPIFCLTLFELRVRYCYQQVPFYIALLLWIAMLMPNMIWLIQHHFAAFHWINSEVTQGLTWHALSALVTTFYPLLFLWLILLSLGARFHWVDRGSDAWLLSFIVLMPLLMISVFFTLNDGGRLSEWLQPFLLLLTPLMVGWIGQSPKKSCHHAVMGLVGAAVLVMSGYLIVMICNIGGAGQKNAGIKALSHEIANSWWANYHQPVHYVGGSTLSQWLTFYLPEHPTNMTPWSNKDKPNIYSTHITWQAIKKYGAVLISERGQRCSEANFSKVFQQWTSIRIAHQQTLYYALQPDNILPVCVAFVSPEG